MVTMPRVLLISRCPPWPLHLGDRLIIWHLARELAQRGYTIDLLAFTRQPEDHDEISRYRSYFGDVSLFDEPLRSPLTLLRRLLLPQTRFPRLAARASSPAMWRAIEDRVRRYNYDCVHFFGGIQVSEYRHAIGDLPALITPYESYSLYLKHEIAARNSLAPGSRMRHYMARRFESWMFTPFLSRVVISERDRAELRNINPALDWEVIPIGVDLEYFQPRQEPREPATLIFTGNFDYEPNAEAAVWLARELMPELRQQVPGAKLWLVGNVSHVAMHALASEDIHVSGRVPDLRPWLARATLFVCPLQLGAGIKFKVLETLAAGCPLVATPLSVDGIAVISGQHALLAERSELPAALRTLLGDAALRQRLARAGRELVEVQYSWQQVAGRYAALYESLGAERPCQ